MVRQNVQSVTFLAQESFLVRPCTVFFPFTSASCFLLSKCLQPSSVVSHILMARASEGTDVPVSPVLASSSNMGSPDGSKEQDTVPVRWKR